MRKPDAGDENQEASQVVDKSKDIKEDWRWGWDSSPRRSRPLAGFQDRKGAHVSVDESDGYGGDAKSWASSWASVLERYPDARKVIEFWPKLPEVMRRGIVGMVTSVCRKE